MAHQVPPVPPKPPAIEFKSNKSSTPVVEIRFEKDKAGRTVTVHYVAELCDNDRVGTITCYVPGDDDDNGNSGARDRPYRRD